MCGVQDFLIAGGKPENFLFLLILVRLINNNANCPLVSFQRKKQQQKCRLLTIIHFIFFYCRRDILR